MLFMETSSKMDVNVEKAFNNMTHQVLQKIKYKKFDPTKEAGISMYNNGRPVLKKSEGNCSC